MEYIESEELSRMTSSIDTLTGDMLQNSLSAPSRSKKSHSDVGKYSYSLILVMNPHAHQKNGRSMPAIMIIMIINPCRFFQNVNLRASVCKH